MDSLEFIERAKLKFGNKYDYSKVNYINPKTKVEIICPEHGSFFQYPYNHLQGHGCPKCASRDKNRLDNAEFIEKAKSKFGDKYDYSKVKYIDYYTEVEVICPIHGAFWQKPANHLSGSGCPTCANINRGNGKRLLLEEFISKAQEVHGEDYNYSEIKEYKNGKEPVKIFCNKCHNYFFQTPSAHLAGNGCPICNGGTNKLKFDNIRFIEKCKIKFPELDYSKTEYTGCNQKTTFICPKHGEFIVRADFLRGCPACIKEKKLEAERTKIKSDIEERWGIELLEPFIGFYNYNPKSLKKYSFKCLNCGNVFQQGIRWNRNMSCPMCHPISHGSSKGEIELYNLFLTTGYKVLHNDRKQLDGKELDIFLPELNFAIEYDGAYWHNKEEDELKNKICQQKGIKLFRVDDAKFTKDRNAVLEEIKAFFGIDFNFKAIKEINYSSDKCQKIINLESGKVYNNYREVVKEFGFKSAATLLNVCNGRFKSYHGYHFRFANY